MSTDATGCPPADVPATAPACDDQASTTPAYVTTILEAAEAIRSWGSQGSALARLLAGVAAREMTYLAVEPRADQPQPGDETWLAWALGCAYLGQELPDGA